MVFSHSIWTQFILILAFVNLPLCILCQERIPPWAVFEVQQTEQQIRLEILNQNVRFYYLDEKGQKIFIVNRGTVSTQKDQKIFFVVQGNITRVECIVKPKNDCFSQHNISEGWIFEITGKEIHFGKANYIEINKIQTIDFISIVAAIPCKNDDSLLAMYAMLYSQNERNEWSTSSIFAQVCSVWKDKSHQDIENEAARLLGQYAKYREPLEQETVKWLSNPIGKDLQEITRKLKEMPVKLERVNFVGKEK